MYNRIFAFNLLDHPAGNSLIYRTCSLNVLAERSNAEYRLPSQKRRGNVETAHFCRWTCRLRVGHVLFTARMHDCIRLSASCSTGMLDDCNRCICGRARTWGKWHSPNQNYLGSTRLESTNGIGAELNCPSLGHRCIWVQLSKWRNCKFCASPQVIIPA